jgi:hypothetical protein
MIKQLAKWALLAAERLYLWAHGWRRIKRDSYTLPADYPFRRKYETYTLGHAVNAQKAVDGRNRLEDGMRAPRSSKK